MGSSLLERFCKYHNDNPQVFELFLFYSRKVKDSGFDRFSAKAIFERMRWHYWIETKDPDTSFRLNNNYTAFYSRMAMDKYPEFTNFFETREQIGLKK